MTFLLWDQEILFWFNSWVFAYPGLDAFFVFLLDWGIAWMFIGCALLFFAPFLPRFRAARKQMAKFLFLGFFSVFLARIIGVEIVRLFFDRSRPFEVFDTLSVLITETAFGASYYGVDAFPSGHAAVSFALASSVFAFSPKIGAFFFLGALGVSLARVSAGLHWPSDILAGAILGICATWAARRVFKKFFVNFR